MERPPLTPNLDKAIFLRCYWLKEELVAFSREQQLPTSGSKIALTERIAHFLATGERKTVAKKRVKKGTIPSKFSRETIIGEGWRCSQELREFFEDELGKQFHFNRFMRAFIKEDGVGQPLEAAISGWIESKNQPKGSQEIESQFEYNTHIRAYFKENENGTLKGAIASWNEIKAARNQGD